MTGRKAIVAAAAGDQPRRRWELTSSSAVRDTWRRDDGHELDVWFIRSGAVRQATLTSPAGQHRYVSSRAPGKVATITSWLADPAAAFERSAS